MNTVKKRFTSNGSANPSPNKKHADESKANIADSSSYGQLSPELVPIVTLLSSQSHRRYHEGIIMLYYDLNGDGKPADREWKEVYGILTGNQLAYWDAANLAEFRNNPEALLETSSKPNYINFTDSVYNAMKSLSAAKQNLDNVIIVSTTLKNRYIIQFKSYQDLTTWYSALRLANYEYSSLQEAYTGALLSARGSRLSDIRTILAEKRFDHEDWVSIRYGSGMAWKRCYAVIEPSVSKKKSFTPGRILFYENDQKKKKQLMAVVTNSSIVTAIYPQSHLLIDQSTMLKLDAFINFKSPSVSTKVSKKSIDDFKNTSIFLMPEQHSSVPGFDTLIRFLIPLLDSFGLYGRPKRLKADRVDPDSLLFGLPTLPHVHYLELDDVIPLTSKGDFLSWDAKQWTANLKGIMKSKLDRGYEGCGSTRGVAGALSSLSSPTSSTFRKASSPTKQQHSFPRQSPPPQQIRYQQPVHDFSNSSESIITSSTSNQHLKNVNDLSIKVQGPNGALPNNSGGSLITNNTALTSTSNKKGNSHRSVQLDDIYQNYSTIMSPSDQFHTNRNQLLNGSHEELVEDELPSSVRKINLTEQSTDVYPKNDDDLFSDDDQEEDVEDDEKVDARQIGVIPQDHIDSLPLPHYNNRNSSYSSVQSPMTQYQEFNEQFSKTLDRNEVLPLKTEIKGEYSTYSNSGYENSNSSPPSPPPHQSFAYDQQSSSRLAKSVPSHSLSESINSVPQGITTPRGTQNSIDHLSIHSESGKVTSGTSSPYSQNSGDDIIKQQNSNVSSHSSIPSHNPNPHLRPKYITSPNNSQNQIPRFASAESNQATVAPASGYQQQNKAQKPQPQQGRPIYPQQPINPQAPPQKPIYPYSSQFGYAPQPRPQPEPLTSQQQYRPQPLPQAPLYQQQQQQYPMHQQYPQSGIPPSVAYQNNIPQQHRHPQQYGMPPSQKPSPNNYVPRNYPQYAPTQNAAARGSHNSNTNQHTYQQAGIPPSVNQPQQQSGHRQLRDNNGFSNDNVRHY